MSTKDRVDIADELARAERMTPLLNDELSRRMVGQYIRDIQYDLLCGVRAGTPGLVTHPAG